MPAYRVLERGFFEGKMYDPRGKRDTMHRDEPFATGEMPSWVKPITEAAANVRTVKQTDEERAEAVRTELNAMGVEFNARLGLAKLEALLAKSKNDIEVAAVTFVEAPKATQESSVVTL